MVWKAAVSLGSEQMNVLAPKKCVSDARGAEEVEAMGSGSLFDLGIEFSGFLQALFTDSTGGTA
jgi:hypothetical protein